MVRIVLFEPRVSNSQPSHSLRDTHRIADRLHKHAYQLRTLCGRIRVANERLLDKSVHDTCWHDVDVLVGVDVHQLCPNNRALIIAPAHVGQFLNVEDRLSVGRLWLECGAVHRPPTIALCNVVCHLLRTRALCLGSMSNAYLTRVTVCEFISYEGKLLDILQTELMTVSDATECALPKEWAKLVPPLTKG